MMKLDGLKRWIHGSGAARHIDWHGVQPWAAEKGYNFRRVQPEGFVIDGRSGTSAWRLEWGPPQRPYIEGMELRLRCELGLDADLQAVLMNRELQDQLEKRVFDQYVEGVQTRIDDQTPQEMRWLVMFPKLTGTEMGGLRERYVALASKKSWLLRWMKSPLHAALASHRVNAAVPLVMAVARGRLTLRTEMPDATVAELRRWLTLFETAAVAALAAQDDALLPTTAAAALDVVD